jgi:hypothetical protein
VNPAGDNVSQPTPVAGRRFFAFWIANVFIALFFDGFWLLGYRIQAFDTLSEHLGYFQFGLWFISYFFVPYFALRATVKECLLHSVLFSFLLFCLIGVSTVLLGPYLDPWY